MSTDLLQLANFRLSRLAPTKFANKMNSYYKVGDDTHRK